MADIDVDALLQMMRGQKDRLTRIARFKADSYRPDDLMGELWLAAVSVADLLPVPLDLNVRAHQDAVLVELSRCLDRAGRRAGPRAASLDQPLGGDPNAASLMDLLADESAEDPVGRLMHEGADEPQPLLPREEIAGTYSEAAAFLVLFDRVDGSFPQLAALLCTSAAVLRARLVRVMDRHRRQARLFDGICFIHADFPHSVRRRHAARRADAPVGQPGAFWPIAGDPAPRTV